MQKPDNYYSFYRPDIRDFLPSAYKTTLEIGCGEGNFTQHLKMDAEKWGVEPHAPAARKAVSKFSKVLIGRYEDVSAKIPNKMFDLIICNDVIEHMIDHSVFLESIYQKMKPGGVLVGSVPNVRYYRILSDLIIYGDWRYSVDGVMDNTHLRWFTQKSLYRTLQEHGMKVEMIKGHKSVMEGRKKWTFRKDVILLQLLSALSFGHFGDIQYRQIAFRAVKEVKKQRAQRFDVT